MTIGFMGPWKENVLELYVFVAQVQQSPTVFQICSRCGARKARFAWFRKFYDRRGVLPVWKNWKEKGGLCEKKLANHALPCHRVGQKELQFHGVVRVAWARHLDSAWSLSANKFFVCLASKSAKVGGGVYIPSMMWPQSTGQVFLET